MEPIRRRQEPSQQTLHAYETIVACLSHAYITKGITVEEYRAAMLWATDRLSD